MARFSDANLAIANEIISRYPRPKSALIPLLHLAQEQDGWVTDDAMRHLAELTGTTPAEVKGTGSFYEMFKFHPVGKYMVNVCTNLSCQLLGGEELLEHAEATLGAGPEVGHHRGEVVGTVHRFDHDPEVAQVVAPHVLQQLGVVLALDPDAAGPGHLGPAVAGDRTRCRDLLSGHRSRPRASE